jgi:hypothetical protein
VSCPTERGSRKPSDWAKCAGDAFADADAGGAGQQEGIGGQVVGQAADFFGVAGLRDSRLDRNRNGEEFHSKAFERGAAEYGIRLTYRPRGAPQVGGHIERLIALSCIAST